MLYKFDKLNLFRKLQCITTLRFLEVTGFLTNECSFSTITVPRSLDSKKDVS